MDIWMIALFTAIALFTSFFSVMMGGAGLVLTPMMLAFGVPPAQAISSTKFSFLGTSTTAALKFHKYYRVEYKLAVPLAIFAIAGGIIGSNAVIGMDPAVLKFLIGLTMITILGITAFTKDLGESDHPVEMTPMKLLTGGLLVIISVFIATITGGGAAVLITYILILIFGESFLHSAGTQAIISDISLITISAVFIYHGVITWQLAVPLLIANVIGANLGSSYCVIKGNHWVKKVFVGMILILSVKLLLPFLI